MPFLPFSILGMWLRGLLALAVLAGGLALLGAWYHDAHAWEPVRAAAPEPAPEVRDRPGDGAGPTDRVEPAAAAPVVVRRRVWDFRPGWNRPTAELAAAVALLTWALGGLAIARGIAAAGLKAGTDDPTAERGGEVLRLRRPGGAEIRVECYGPPDAPPLVLTHGWGANSTEWYYVKKALAGRFRVVVWDLPGLGLSKKPDDNDYRLETLAGHLDAVVAAACGDRPAVLAGHSIGGMITLTYARLFPGALGTRAAGLVVVHSTYTNPVRTTRHAALYTALEKPVLVPLLHLTVWLWPLVWALNWLSYLNGSAHRSTHKESFAGTETRGQLDFVARFMPHARPDVLARGMFGMLAYDATPVLPTIPVPVLVVEGDRDTTCTPEASRTIAREVPRPDLLSLSPARHMGLIERHAAFDPALAEFAAAALGAGAVR